MVRHRKGNTIRFVPFVSLRHNMFIYRIPEFRVGAELSRHLAKIDVQNFPIQKISVDE